MLSPITPKKAKNLIWNFHNQKSHKKSISVTFPCDELKNFIEQCISDGNPKVRVYFGQYGKNTKVDNNNKHGYATVVFVPVDENGNDNYSENIVQPPLNEGQICPPPDPCNGLTLYRETEDTSFNPNDVA